MKNWKRNKEEFLSNLYAHMKERVTNPAKSRFRGRKIGHYFGLALCSKEDFLNFALNDKKFSALFIRYKRSRGDRRLAPSIDRINNNKGYVKGNLQFLTISENVKKDSNRRWIFLKNLKTGKIHGFAKTRSASIFLGQKGRVNLRYRRFTNLKTGIKYLNVTKTK